MHRRRQVGSPAPRRREPATAPPRVRSVDRAWASEKDERANTKRCSTPSPEHCRRFLRSCQRERRAQPQRKNDTATLPRERHEADPRRSLSTRVGGLTPPPPPDSRSVTTGPISPGTIGASGYGPTRRTSIGFQVPTLPEDIPLCSAVPATPVMATPILTRCIRERRRDE
jgi:hypothetical protein